MKPIRIRPLINVALAILIGVLYAAIAYSTSTGKYATSWGWGTRAQAEQAALSKCAAQDAKIVGWVNNGFIALALGDDKGCWGAGWSYGDGASTTEARNYALSKCSEKTTGAKVVVCICSVSR